MGLIARPSQSSPRRAMAFTSTSGLRPAHDAHEWRRHLAGGDQCPLGRLHDRAGLYSARWPIYEPVEGTPPLALDIPEAPRWLLGIIGTARRVADTTTPACELDTRRRSSAPPHI
jgi:hypothetical protein